jgi:peroxiredoxin
MRKAKILSLMSLFIIGSHLSLAIALRHLKQGDSVPNLAIRTIDGNHISLNELKGKITVLAFWKQNDGKSCKMLMDLSRISQELRSKDVTFLAINGDNASDRQVREMALSKKLTCVFASDPDSTTYRRLGIVVLPTTLIIGPDGKLVCTQDLYSRNFYTQTIAYVRFLLGEITQSQLNAELDPGKSVETSKARIKAERYIFLGQMLMANAQLKHKAFEVLTTASQTDPSYIKPHALLAKLYLENKLIDKAAAELEKAFKLSPVSELQNPQLTKAIALSDQGYNNESLSLFQDCLKNHPNPPAELYFRMGRIYEKQNQISLASQAYHHTVEILLAE